MDKGVNVIQLETASGAAIQSFEGAQGINVPRRRFLPVKTTSDLLLVMSNLFTLNRGNLVMNPQRSFPSVPLVKLGTSFTKVSTLLLLIKFNRFVSFFRLKIFFHAFKVYLIALNSIVLQFQVMSHLAKVFHYVYVKNLTEEKKLELNF